MEMTTLFYCFDCEKEFPNRNEHLEWHEKTKTPLVKTIICPYCDEDNGHEYGIPKHYQQHLAEAHSNIPYNQKPIKTHGYISICHYCEEVFYDYDALRKHELTHDISEINEIIISKENYIMLSEIMKRGYNYDLEPEPKTFDDVISGLLQLASSEGYISMKWIGKSAKKEKDDNWGDYY
jgi:hypothetical protein